MKNAFGALRLLRIVLCGTILISLFLPFYFITLSSIILGTPPGRISFGWGQYALWLFPATSLFIIVSTLNGELDGSRQKLLILLLPLLLTMSLLPYLVLKYHFVMSFLKTPLFSLKNYGLYILLFCSLALPLTYSHSR